MDQSEIEHQLNMINYNKYDTGWINRSDWTNVHLGSNTGLNVDSNVTHNLNKNISGLIYKVLISTDGTDNNSFEILPSFYSYNTSRDFGITVYQIDNNNFKAQTGINGLMYLGDNGVNVELVTQNYYYKVVVFRLGI